VFRRTRLENFLGFLCKLYGLLAANESVVQRLASLCTILVVASLNGLGIEGKHENEGNNTENENECECTAVALITGSAEEQTCNNNRRSRADGRTDGAHESEYATEVLTAPVLSAERNTEVGRSTHEHCNEDHCNPEDGAAADETKDTGDNHKNARDNHSLLGADLGIDEADNIGANATEDHNSGHNSAVLLFADTCIDNLHGLAHETDCAGEKSGNANGAEPEFLALDGIEVVPNRSLLVLDLGQHNLGSDFGSEALVVVTECTALLGIILDEDETDQPANDGDDEEGQECHEDGVANTEGNCGLSHSFCHAKGSENGGCEGSEKTVCNGECESCNTHNGTLSGGEPLADQEAESQGGVQNGYDVDESIGAVPYGTGEHSHDEECQDDGDDTKDATECLDALHLCNQANQNDLDNDTDDCAGGVDAGDELGSAVEVGEDVQGILGEDLEGDVGDCLIQDQHPASETEANGFLLHFVFSSQKE